MMGRHIINCRVDIHVCERIIDDHGCPFNAIISTISANSLNVEITDDEYEAISHALMLRGNEYCSVLLVGIPGCEWLFHKVVRGIWNKIVRKYKTITADHTIIHEHSYCILLPDNRFISPSARVLSLDTPEESLGFEDIPEHTVYNELPSGNLELVRAGRDFPRNMYDLPISFPFALRKPFANVIENSVGPHINKIVKVGDRAFEGFDQDFRLILPNCKEIGDSAFARCLGLWSVCLPNVEHIGDYAFCDCHFLHWMKYPEHIRSIGEGAFEGCMNMKSFYKNKDLDPEEVITLPNHVHVGRDAFEYTPMRYLSYNDYDKPYLYGNEEDEWEE